MANFEDNSAYELEFKSTSDDAWYTCRLILQDQNLTVKLFNFSDSCDEKFSGHSFKTPQAVDEFCERFRPISRQVQDNNCSKITKGITVCASLTSKDKADVRYYDALVQAVHRREHLFTKKEEECHCTFVLFWKHGPMQGNLTSCNIADICLIQSGAQVDSRLVSFSKSVKEKINMASVKSEDRFHTIKGRVQECCEFIDHDRDMGGGYFDTSIVEKTGSEHFIIIENLEKDLSPSSIMEFIYKHTSISPQAYVFPSLSYEPFTRGAIVLDCEVKLRKISDFLCNPNHVIMSSKGRPWVVSEKMLKHGNFGTTLGSLMPTSQDELQLKNIDNVLKVVRLGTEAYRIANQLKELFIDFSNHQYRLHQRLAWDERKTLQPFNGI